MEFEWDPAKNEANRKKHGFGFQDAARILTGDHVVFPSPREGEARWGAIGILNDRYVMSCAAKGIGLFRSGGQDPMKKERIVSYTSEELVNMPSDTDWERVNAMTEAEIEQKALDDPDSPPLTEEQLRHAVRVVPGEEGKERISLWIDKDVLRYFGKGSRGYQKRLNAALRKVMVAELLYGNNMRA